MLTTRQQEIWQFLAEYVDAHGYPPTVREIGDAVGLLRRPSTRTSRIPSAPVCSSATRRSHGRSSSSAESARRPSNAPLLSRLPAPRTDRGGGPLLAEQEVEEQIAVPCCSDVTRTSYSVSAATR